MKRFLSSMCWGLLIANVASAQTPFQNLDFETFIPNSIDPLFGELPGWGGGGFGRSVGLNSVSYLTNEALAGAISVVFETGYEIGPDGTLVDPLTFDSIGISQTGFVPLGSRSIRLLANSDPVVTVAGEEFGVWSVSLGDRQIRLTELSPGEWGGDFSPGLAGTTQTLSIDAVGSTRTTFDDISFSSQRVSSVPEPSSTLALIGALLGFASQRRRKSSLRNSGSSI